jgi:hypothetical protein
MMMRSALFHGASQYSAPRFELMSNGIGGVMVSVLASSAVIRVNSTIFHLYYGENKLIVNEMMMRSALFHGASSQKQQSKDRHVPLLGHIILIRAN